MAIDNQRAEVSAILCGLEATYGVDPTLSPATHGVLINKGAEITPNADKEARNVIRTTHSPAGSIIGAKSLDLSLQVEARGGGMAPDGITPLPPDYDPLLQCCGMQRRDAVRLAVPAGGAWLAGETVTGATSTATGVIEYIERDGLLVVVLDEGSADFAIESITGGTSNVTATATTATKALLYQPVTARVSEQSSVASYFWKDAVLHKVLGALGSWSLDAQVGKTATFDFKLSGLWSDPVDADLPAPTLTELAGIQALGMGVKIGDYTPVCTALKLDLGAKVEKRNDINAAEGLVGMLITGREPSGSLDPEVDKLSKYNPWELWKTGTKSKITGHLGSTPGNRIAFYLGAAQRSDLKYGNRVGLATYAESFTPCQVRTGDDELYLCFF